MSDCPFCSARLTEMPRPSDQPVLSVCDTCMNPLAIQYEGTGWRLGPVRGMQDIRQIAQAGSIGEELLKMLHEAMENLPILPEIAQRIMALLRDPDAGLPELVDLIGQDQVIALKILRLANSAVYGGLMEVRDLRAACVRLGMRTVANTVQAIASGRIYSAKDPHFAEMMENLWRHAMASAQCANDIAVLIAEPRAEVLFMAGLIHDVGKVLLLDVIGNAPKSGAVKAVRESPELFAEVTRGYYPLVGLHVVRRWKLPYEFGITTFCHSQVETAPSDSWLGLVYTVALSSALADASGFGEPLSDISLLNHPATKFLGLNDIKLATLRIDLEDKVQPLLEATSAAA